MKEYEEVVTQGRKAATLNGILNLLTWDQEVFMPKGAIESRSSQIALMAHMIHEERTSKGFRHKLEALIDLDSGKIKHKGLTDLQKSAVYEFRKDFLKQTKLPSSFIKEFSETTSLAVQIWAKAKKENDFAAFAPSLEKIVKLNQKKADILGYENHPYDALIDLFEPGMKTSKLETLFSSLENGLSSLIKKVQEKPHVNDAFLFQTFEREKQILFGNLLLDELKIDSECMRLDESVHPFSIAMHPTDSRITTRIAEKNFMSSITSVLHEVGHGLYECNLPQEHFGTPLCDSLSIGIHESQSRLWETLIGYSKPFWDHFYPLLQNTFSKQLSSVDFDQFYKAIHNVKPSLIRVDSDEVSYCLHILLRFDLEKALIEGSLSVKDLPHVWKEKMQELFGICPQTDSEGCLQDIHWACGDFGYFPTYALGNLYAAHFFEGFSKKHALWEKDISKGDFSVLKTFLKEEVHCHGRRYSQEELAMRITGRELSDQTYLNYLEKKYLQGK